MIRTHEDALLLSGGSQVAQFIAACSKAAATASASSPPTRSPTIPSSGFTIASTFVPPTSKQPEAWRAHAFEDIITRERPDMIIPVPRRRRRTAGNNCPRAIPRSAGIARCGVR